MPTISKCFFNSNDTYIGLVKNTVSQNEKISLYMTAFDKMIYCFAMMFGILGASATSAHFENLFAKLTVESDVKAVYQDFVNAIYRNIDDYAILKKNLCEIIEAITTS